MSWWPFPRKPKPGVSAGVLIGVWSGNGTELHIRSDGTMDYIIILPDRRQIIKLTWRVEGDEIVSNQPSAPGEERTKYSFENEQLILTFGGERTSYKRVGE